MRRGRVSATLALSALGLCLGAAPGASAATEVGNTCQSAAETGNTLMVQLKKAAGTGLLETPAAGVLTSWRVNAGPGAPQTIEKLKAIKQLSPTEFEVVADSPEELVRPNRLNVFPARMPVPAGVRFAAYAPKNQAVLYCTTGSLADEIGYNGGLDVPVGAVTGFANNPEYEVALSAVIEPDADGDGFGDESQDGCPRSKALQVACPPLGLGIYAIAGRASATALISASADSQIKVTGKGLKAVSHQVGPGQIVKFKLKFSATLRSALAALPAGRSLKLKLKASGANNAGEVSSATRTVRLKGQA